MWLQTEAMPGGAALWPSLHLGAPGDAVPFMLRQNPTGTRTAHCTLPSLLACPSCGKAWWLRVSALWNDSWVALLTP